MSDDTAAATPVAEPEAPAAPKATETEPQVDWRAEAEKWKTLSRQNEAQAKANAEKARQYDAFEESQKTELQKAQDAAAAAQQRAAEAEARALRSDIARNTGVPIELLTAADEETLQAQAEALLAFRGQQQTPPAPASSGTSTPSGAAPIPHFTDAQIAAMTPEEYAARKEDIYRARDAGLISL